MNMKAFTALWFVALLPYVGIAGIVQMVTKEDYAFWYALGILFGGRFFYSVLDAFGGFMAWRFTGRETFINLLLSEMNGLPPKELYTSDMNTYLTEVRDEPSHGLRIQRKVIEIQAALQQAKLQGFFQAMRIDSAADEAVRRFSPRAKAA